MKSEFDQFAGRYSNHLDQMLSPLGSSTDEFARRKSEHLLRLSKRYLGPPRRLRILDLGCGPGNVTRYLDGQFGEVVGADLADDLLKEARQRAPGCTFVTLVPGPLPFPDGHFDLVFCAGVMHHLQDHELQDFCIQMARVTRPGGLVATFEHNPYNPVTRHIVRNCDLDKDVERLIPLSWSRKLFRGAGLTLEEESYISFFPGKLSALMRWEHLLAPIPLGGQYLLVGQKPAEAEPEPLPTVPQPDFSLVLPMYNEEPNVEPVSLELLDAFRKAGVNLELILVDNGSLDFTREKIQGLVELYPEVKLVKVFPNRGFGWGILKGLDRVSGRAVSWTGGDGQISADDVLRIYQRFMQGDVVLCKANRVKRGDGPQRIMITLIWNLLFKVLFNLSDPDINGTPKVMLTKELEWLKLEQQDWFLDAELVLKMADHGATKTEVTVEFLPRLRGRSNVRLPTLWEFFANMIKFRLRFWRNRLRGKGWFE